MKSLYRRIYADDEFHELERRRGWFSWSLAGIVVAAYFSFILVIAFFPALFAVPLGPGRVTSWGIPAGLGVIVLSFVLTGVYVWRANTRFDRMVRHVVERAREQAEAAGETFK